MSWWEGLLLGIVQGLTEFLPVSSSGHLVVAEAALRVRTPGVFVEVVVHVATLFAVVVVYWPRLLALGLGATRGERDTWRFIGLVLLASVPAGLVGILFREWFARTFDSLAIVGVDFLVTGTVLWSTRSAPAGLRETPTAGGTLAVGVAQAVAILPGISRSGSTIATGIWAGLDPVRAAEFSFFMAMPAIAGAALLELPNLTASAASVGAVPLAVSFGAALVSGVAAIRLLIWLLARRAFHRFAPYCWTLGVLSLVWALAGPVATAGERESGRSDRSAQRTGHSAQLTAHR
jgi:undecaprenyl-diphosphatase